MHLWSRTRSRHQARAVATLSAVPLPCNMPQGSSGIVPNTDCTVPRNCKLDATRQRARREVVIHIQDY